MKLLDNVMMYEFEGAVFPFCFEDENETHYYLYDTRDYLRKSRTRLLTTDEQVDYLYDKCCQPHSRRDDLVELCVAFPGLQVQLVFNLDHCNRDEIKFKIKFSLNYPDMP